MTVEYLEQRCLTSQTKSQNFEPFPASKCTDYSQGPKAIKHDFYHSKLYLFSISLVFIG